MKKILTGLMLATASFMLLFTVSNNKTYAYEETESFTFEVYNMAGVNTYKDLYDYLEHITGGYVGGQMSHLTADISLLTYSDAYVTKLNKYFTITFVNGVDTYEFGIDVNGNIELLNDPISNDEYTMTFTGVNKSYEDLFYEDLLIEFEITDNSNMNDIQYTSNSNLYEKLKSTAMNLGKKNAVSVDRYVYQLDFSNDILSITISYDSTYDNVSVGAIISDTYEDVYTFNMYDDTMISDEFIIEVGTYTLRIPTLKPWTQSHSYGRIISNESTLYLNQPSDTAAFLSHSISTNVINVNNIAVGDEIVLQSPYKNFEVSYGVLGQPRQVLVTQENVAAIRMIKNNVDNTNYSFDIWYWTTGGALEFRRQENVNLANRNSLNIKFDGGVRKAIDYLDVMVANVDVLTPLESFLDNIIAFDPIEGDISDLITITNDDGYSPDTVGVYNVEFSVTNSNGQTTSVIAPVHVVDIVAPTITGVTDTINISYDQTFNVTNWVNSLTVSDNYYTGLSISIKENTYTVNKAKLGTYKVTVQSIDPSGNIGTLTRNIIVHDGIGPVFNGITTITASINENITVEQIKAGLAAIDAIDGNVTSSIVIDSDNLTGKANTVGVHEVVFRAVDAAGNQTLHTVTVTIVASPPGFFILNSNSVRLLPGANLTIEQILNILNASDAQNISTNYNASVAGTYNLSFTLNGESHTISITVLGQNESIIPEPIIPGDTSNGFGLTYTILLTLSVAAVGIVGYIVLKKKRK